MSSDTSPIEYMTVQEAARALGVRDSTVRSALLRSRLRFVVLNDRKMIAKQDVENYRLRTQPDGIIKIGRRKRVTI